MIIVIFALLNHNRVRASYDLEYGLDYHCPQPDCDSSELILKKGVYKHPHFAHKSSNTCDTYSEPETQAHIAMKKCMQDTLNISEDFVEYNFIQGVRPDLVWDTEDYKFAIEVQHSFISENEVKRRNQIYINNNFIPIWIFHAEESPTDSYYNKGNYGKYYKRNHCSILKLNKTEKFIGENYGLLLYLYFSKTNLLRQLIKNQDSLKKPNLKFTKDKGPWLYINLIERVEDRNTLFRFSTTHINDISVFKEIINLFYIQKERPRLYFDDLRTIFKKQDIRRHTQLAQSKNALPWLQLLKVWEIKKYIIKDYFLDAGFKFHSSLKAYSFFYRSERCFISINPTILFSPMIALVTKDHYTSDEDLPGIRYFQCLSRGHYFKYRKEALILRFVTCPGIDYYIYTRIDFLNWINLQANILEPSRENKDKEYIPKLKTEHKELIAKLNLNKNRLSKWV